VTVFKDLRDRWVSTRPVWNQHAYHVTNVGDDGLSIPVRQQPHYADPKTNNFRMNSMGTVDYSAPDLQVDPARDVTVQTASCPAALTVRVRIWNRGTSLVAPGVPVAIYAAGSTPIATAATKGAIVPGQSETVVLAVSPGPTSATDLRVAVNDDGTGQPIVGECRADNGAALLPGARCPASSL
jgi:hypothetical protein